VSTETRFLAFTEASEVVKQPAELEHAFNVAGELALESPQWLHARSLSLNDCVVPLSSAEYFSFDGLLGKLPPWAPE
jgi:hypothetical protein